MSLPYDVARCSGVFFIDDLDPCKSCARKDKGREEYQAYVSPQIDLNTGKCPNYINRVSE
jgi:hypothetical protein